MGIIGVILGILGLIAAVVATLFFGLTGGIVAVVLGAVAILLGVLNRKKSGRGGVGAMVIGILAVVVAVALIPTTQNMMTTMKNRLMNEFDQQGSKFATVAKYVEPADTNGGFMGFITSMAGSVSEEDKAAFEAEIKDLGSLVTENSDSSAPAPATPAEESAPEAPAEAPAEEPAG